MGNNLATDLASDLDESFPELVTRFQNGVFSGLRQLAGDHHRAEDLTQETFIRAYLALRSYPAERIRGMRLRGWVWTIALNLLRNDVRSSARRPVPVQPRDAGYTPSEPPDSRAWRRRWGLLPPDTAAGGDPATCGGAVLPGDNGGHRQAGQYRPKRRPPGPGKTAVDHRGRDERGAKPMTLERQLQGLSVAAPSSVSGGVALGTGLSDGFSVFESPLGSVVVAFNPLGVSAVDLLTDGFQDRFAERFRRRLLEARPPSDWEELILRALAQGTPGALPVDFRSVTAFQRQVLEHTAAIPRGETRSYGWLAGRAGRPRRRTGGGTDHGPESRSPGDSLSSSGAVRRRDRPLRIGRHRAQASPPQERGGNPLTPLPVTSAAPSSHRLRYCVEGCRSQPRVGPGHCHLP